MAYPSKPWTNGQIATGIVQGETYIYDASQGTWVHQTKATIDSDYQVDKAATASSISAIDTRLTTAEGEIDTLQATVNALAGMSDSETARIQQNITDITTAYAMLDSDGTVVQSLQTQIDGLTTSVDHDSDITALNTSIAAVQSNVDAIVTAVVSATQPTGVTGQLWVNLNDGKLYYWNDSDAFVSIVTV